jgi:hypothetical protein
MPVYSNARYSRLTLRISTAHVYTGTVSWVLYVTFCRYNGIIVHINVSYTKSIYAGCRFNPVKNRYGSERKWITLEIEPVSLYLVFKLFRYGTVLFLHITVPVPLFTVF